MSKGNGDDKEEREKRVANKEGGGKKGSKEEGGRKKSMERVESLREIKRYQSSTKMLIRRLPFQRVV